jgi:hypothetical protein
VNDDLGRRVKELAAKLHDTRYGMEMWPVLLADAIESAQRDAAEAERERCVIQLDRAADRLQAMVDEEHADQPEAARERIDELRRQSRVMKEAP